MAANDGLTLSYTEVETLVRALHDVDDRRAGALFARFKYLQRMGFPARPSVGRGSRVGYSFDAVLQLVLVFQLMEVGIAPLRIVRTLRTGWPRIRETLAGAHRWMKAMKADEDEPEDDMLVITPAALFELGVDESADAPVTDPLEPDNRYHFDEWLISDDWQEEVPAEGPIPSWQRSCCKVVVDPVRVVHLVASVLSDRLGRSPEAVDAAFQEFAPPLPR